jgi:hypothetical protein
MEKDGISKMKASPEMDAMIAENLFGWSDVKEINYLGGGMQWRGTNEIGQRSVPVHNYSTNMAYAWEVVEKLADILPGVVSVQHEFHRDGSGTICFIRQYPDSNAKWITHDESAPLAICRAALLAVKSGV